MEKAFSLISNRNFKENVLFSLNFLLSAGNWGEMRRDWVQGSSPSYRGNQDGRKAEEFASKHWLKIYLHPYCFNFLLLPGMPLPFS